MAQSNETFSGYIQRVRRFLHEANAGASFFSDDMLKELFNDSYRRRCSQLTMSFEGYFVDIAEADLEQNQARYAWPPGFERLHKMELVRTDGRTVPLQRYERHKFVNPPSQTGGDNYLPNYRPIGSGFILEPAPSETVTDGLRIEYVGLPARLVADGDTLHADFPVTFASLLIYDTVSSALDSEGMQENGVVKTVLRLRQEFEWDFERYIDSRMQSTNVVTPFRGPYHDA